MTRVGLSFLAALALVGCTLARPEWEPEIEPCHIPVIVDGEPRECISRREFDERWRKILTRD